MSATNGATTVGAVVRVAGRAADGADVAAAASESATTTPVVEVGSTGAFGLEPLVLLTRQGQTAFHANVTPDEVVDLVDAFESGSLSPEAAHAVVDHSTGQTTLPTPGDGPLAVGTRQILGRCGWVEPSSIDDIDDFVSAFAASDTQGAAKHVARLGILGRGRGDDSANRPVVQSWLAAQKSGGDPVVVVNAHESDRSNRSDRTLVEGDALAVVDAALAVCSIVGAADLVVYCNEADSTVTERAWEALSVLEEAGSPASATRVVTGPDRLIAGEPQRAMEFIDGHSGDVAGPSSGDAGFEGRPKIIHTPRTLLQVRRALQYPHEFDASSDPGTRLLTVTGDVKTPATVELPRAGRLEAVLDAVTMDGTFKLASVGGRFGGITPTLDYPPTASELENAHLGSEGLVEVFDEQQCVVALVDERARAARDESECRCDSCRETAPRVADLVDDVYAGRYAETAIRELVERLSDSCTCGFGQVAARPVSTAIATFDSEFLAHADGHCSTGACQERFS
ncbi:MAG: NADH-ubiquinone oxidoreductase-F iron-sulfur binding region domain-containing protein [Halobacteriota archaeon]